jgi:hypothetical protein
VQAAVLLEDIEDESDDPSRLLVRLKMLIAIASPHRAHGRMIQEFPALGLIAPAFVPAAFENRECSCVPHASQPQQHTIIVVGWIIQAIGIGQHGPKNGTEFEPLVPIFIGARQSAQFQPQNHPDVVSADLSQEPLEAQTRGHTLATLAVILINDTDPLREPSIGDSALHEGILPGRGFHRFDALVWVGLAHIHHRLSP